MVAGRSSLACYAPLPGRLETGVAEDAPACSWGRGKLSRFLKGWSGSHSRRLRGYRLYLTVDCDSAPVSEAEPADLSVGFPVLRPRGPALASHRNTG
jgi:hypothetical protein